MTDILLVVAGLLYVGLMMLTWAMCKTSSEADDAAEHWR